MANQALVAKSTDKDKLDPYSHDEVTDPHYMKEAQVVVLPATTEEVSKVVKLCYDNDIVMVPRAAGTGLAAGAVCMFTLVYRTRKSAAMPPKKAKAQMLWGLFIRLFAVFAALFAAVQDSKPVFFAAAAALLACYGGSMLLFLRYAYRLNRGSE